MDGDPKAWTETVLNDHRNFAAGSPTREGTASFLPTGPFT